MVVCAESSGSNEFPFVRHHVVREEGSERETNANKRIRFELIESEKT